MDQAGGGLSRRDLMRAGLGAGAGILLTPALAGAAEASAPPPAPPLRIAHLTDVHVQPELRAAEGYAAALDSLKRLDPPPAFIVSGGDHVMDCTGQTLARTKVQWGIYEKAVQGTKFPVHSIIGNHDIFGWGRPREVPESTAGYGRAMALDRLRMKRNFYSFDAGGWRFMMLDSMTRRGNSYLGQLGPEQTEWLEGELQSARDGAGARAGRHLIIFSHIPVLSACVFFDGDRLDPAGWNVPDAWMHRDARALVDLFQAHGVKLAVSGHVHLIDRVEYRGTSFICDGAVCGDWWKGPRLSFPEGYGVFDLHPDGRFEHRYVTYGWKAQKA